MGAWLNTATSYDASASGKLSMSPSTVSTFVMPRFVARDAGRLLGVKPAEVFGVELDADALDRRPHRFFHAVAAREVAR